MKLIGQDGCRRKVQIIKVFHPQPQPFAFNTFVAQTKGRGRGRDATIMQIHSFDYYNYNVILGRSHII